MATRYVEISKRAGDNRTSLSGGNYGEFSGHFADAGMQVGEYFGGEDGGSWWSSVGRAVGSFLGDIFGGGGGRDEVRDIMRGIVGSAISSAMPGKVSYVGSARDIPKVNAQVREADMRGFLEELHRYVVAGLPVGTDQYTDMSLAFNSMVINSADSPTQYTILIFDVEGNGGNTSTGTGGGDDSARGGGGSTTGPNKLFGLSPIVIGGLALLGVAIIGRK